jgi:poly(3-hydroxybutyrate) depolymerase
MFLRFFLMLVCTAVLSACGGGSTASPTSTTPPASADGISGTVTLAGANTPLAGVTLTLGNGVTTVSGADGSYRFSGLAPAPYTITPSLKGVNAFSPSSLSVSLGSNNLTGENFSATSATAVALGGYRVDPAGVTVAGISSGGAMAVQLQVADSASFHGAAIFAGDPYYCNEDDLSTWKAACASGEGIPVATLSAYTNRMAANGLIDPTGNIGSKPIWMFSGTRDTLVDQPVMDQLKAFYLNYTDGANIVYNNTTMAQHAWITPDATNDCTKLGAPFMNNCGFDAEQAFLTMFYGKLAARNATPQGSYVQFNQDDFCSGNCAAISMDSTAWLYVPNNCAGQACKLVVALHGCGQGQQSIGNTFVQQAGINEWADNNNILVLYPQAIISSTPRNPEGCWDWWGYTGTGYALKSAPQMTAIMAMINRITSGQAGKS